MCPCFVSTSSLRSIKELSIIDDVCQDLVTLHSYVYNYYISFKYVQSEILILSQLTLSHYVHDHVQTILLVCHACTIQAYTLIHLTFVL